MEQTVTEPKNKTCQFESKYDPYYQCLEPPLEDSEKGYCIFHEPRQNKNIEKFNEGIKRKLKEKDYNFTGYWFPSLKEICVPFPFRYSFDEDVYFLESTFKGPIHFLESTFKGKADFRWVVFEGYAIFARCIFKEATDFEASTFKGDASFEASAFNQEANFTGTTFGGAILLTDVEIKDFTNAELLFRKAKIGWQQEGNYFKEGEYHYQEMDYIRKQKRWHIRYIWANLFHRCLHGYGEKPHRVILWAVSIVIACALLFMNFGIGETRFFGANLPTYNIFKILPKLYTLSLTDLANIGRYFYFSVVTFTTLGYGDLRPVHPISHLISSIEAFVGMFMMALFVLTFGRKWRR